MREPLIIDDSFVIVNVSAAVENVVRDFIHDHEADLDARLAPHGLQTTDLAALPIARFVYVDEVTAEPEETP
ncbi:hypothetical protein [Paramicrobacterium chengjingii]|uniref:hypothetical protein n=1 Tax=Paramicrobacterium chengjingii TaxID=2769067 RepID=UPI0014214C81|nr:hypothetical protein [Microbacterium chengjingii]